MTTHTLSQNCTSTDSPLEAEACPCISTTLVYLLPTPYKVKHLQGKTQDTEYTPELRCSCSQLFVCRIVVGAKSIVIIGPRVESHAVSLVSLLIYLFTRSVPGLFPRLFPACSRSVPWSVPCLFPVCSPRAWFRSVPCSPLPRAAGSSLGGLCPCMRACTSPEAAWTCVM